MSVSMQLAGGGDCAFAPAASDPVSASVSRLRRAALAQAIESQIVPRLVVSRVPLTVVPPADAPFVAEPASQDAIDLASIAMAGDVAAIRHLLLEARTRQGMESICLDLLAPAARHLGYLWEEDLCSFTDVTIGLLRLHDALHMVAADTANTSPDGLRRHRIVLTPAPGDDHSFGLSMVAAFFRKAGWAVAELHGTTVTELAALLKREWFGVLGFSIGSETRLERLAAMMPRLREVSRNTGLSIMVGGPLLVANPEIATQLGADGTASDGVQATWVAENLLAERSQYS